MIERGLKAPGAEFESAELVAARRRIKELEEQVKILTKAAAAVEEVVPPKARFALVGDLAAEGVSVKRACSMQKGSQRSMTGRADGTTSPSEGIAGDKGLGRRAFMLGVVAMACARSAVPRRGLG